MKTKIKIVVVGLMVVSSFGFSQTLADAIKLTTNEQFEKADAAFKMLIQSQPSNGEYLFYQGENYLKNEQFDKANEAYQKAVEVNATNPFGYVGVGKIQWYNGKQEEAKANFYKATTFAAGKNATVLMKIAEAYTNSETKNLTEALTLLTQATKLEPKNPEVYIVTGDVYLEKNSGTEAITNYEKAGTLDPKSVRAILRQGQVWNRAKNYNLALDTYKKASLIDSSFAPAYREKAEIYFRAGRYNEAVREYKRYLDLNNDCGALGRYAGFLNQAKQYKESIDAATRALQCDPTNVYLYRYKGRSEYDAGDFANGLLSMDMFFDKASKQPSVKIIPEDYEYRAKLLSKNGKDSLAIIEYKKAMEFQPDKIEFFGDIANTYIKMKKYPEAIEAYKIKMAKIKPTMNDYFGLGRAYYFSKDFVNADSSFIQITNAQPDLALGHLWRAKTNSQIDNKNEKWLAKPYYETFLTKVKPEEVEKNKKDLIDAYTYIGVYYINQKDNCTAKKQFQKVLEMDPNNTNGKNFMKSKEATACP